MTPQGADDHEQTLLGVFWRQVHTRADNPALRYYADGAWRVMSWREYGQAVREVAAAYVDLGLGKGDRVAVLSNNRPEWHIADLAANTIGAVVVPVYQTSAPPQIQYAIDYAGARLVVVENDEQMAKTLLVRADMPSLEHIVIVEPKSTVEDPGITTWHALRERGRARLAKGDLDVEAIAASLSLGDPFSIIYTSGTTGNPKGAVITNGNISWLMTELQKVVEPTTGDRFISYLPLSHVAERANSFYSHIASGGETWFARSLLTIAEDLQACRPTIFSAVPRVWEKFREGIDENLGKLTGIQKKFADRYLALGLKMISKSDAGEFFGVLDKFQYDLLDKLVGAKIRHGLGLDKAHYLVSGAAPINADLIRFFHGIGLPIAEGYGQTEDCGPVTLNPPGKVRIGTVGPPIPGADIRIAADGEIIVKAPSVCAGYWNDQAATDDLIDEDGWLHTGDVGEFDSMGYLKITDRKKDLIINAAGQNISPQQIETALKGDPLVGQAVVIGDARPYLTALIGLDPVALAHWAGAHGKPNDAAALNDDPDLVRAVQAVIDRVNAQHARVEGIKKFRLLTDEFTMAGGELTPTLKVKRKVVNDKYASLIEDMYA
ncbi:MAG: long-chain fatty acid--CoA ligase [Acidimicrobiia bacterium]